MPLDDYTIKSYAEKFGSEICCSIVKNMTYLEHVHRSYEILCLLKGQIETEVQGHRFTLNKGDLLFIANGGVHSYASPFESLSLLAAFSPQDAQQFTTILQQSGRQFCYLPAAEINGSLDMAVQGVADGIRNNASRVSLVAYINLILAQVVAGLDKQPVSQSRKNTALDDVLMYISDILPNSIAADDVASHTGVSRFQISRLFSQYIGTNLSTYCALMHINAARRMLVQTNLPISEIYQRCGYANSRSFDRDFVRFSGQTPREYRVQETPGGFTNYGTPFVRDLLLRKWGLLESE